MGKGTSYLEFNVVTVILVLLVLALGYGAWKFIPPYWEAQQVDELLSGAKWEAAKINIYDDDPRGQALLDRVYDGCIELGIDERYLDVYFGDDFRSIHTDYQRLVKHPFIEATQLNFERSEEIPQADMQD